MTDRLKQIWSTFEGTTSRHLTGRGVDNIVVPQRQDYAANHQEEMAPGFQSPADTAALALRSRVLETAKQKERRGKARRGEPEQSFSAPEFHFDAAAHGVSDGAVEMMRGLKSTEFRTERPDTDYSAFLTASGNARKSKRKKIFGIF